jgi:aspartate-semialdehyde dehydrogenase
MQKKSAAESRSGASLFRVAIVGAGTLQGKEIAQALDDRKFPTVDVKLLDDDESLGQLEAVGDEMSFIQAVRSEQFEHVDFTFFSSDPATTQRSWKQARDGGSSIVDLSSALEDEPGARVRSPWLERQRGEDLQLELQPGPAVVAHPVATMLALLVLRAQAAGKLARVVATVFQPVSERGQKGVDELHEQTVNLLSFQEIPKTVFGAQVAFNLLRRLGPEAQPSVESVERRIVKHFRQIAGPDAPIPAVAVLQAPIFHGHALSLYLEMLEPMAFGDVANALSGDHVELSRTADDSPTTVAAAGQEEVLVSVARDPHHENGFWVWATADNLRIAARTAVECAESMAVSRPRGQVQ